MNKARARKSIFAWCLFDWGNSAFGTVIITFVFSVYFARGVVGDEDSGAALWGYAMALSGLLIAVLSPVLGAVADHYGARKPGLLLASLVCAGATMLLYLAVPGAGPGLILIILALLIIANAGFEISLVYANAMLPHIAPPAMIGRISGWAWGLGYAGGLACLVVALLGLVGLGDIKPFLPVRTEQAQNLRMTAPLVALWYLVFTLPLLFFTHDVARTGKRLGTAAREGLGQLYASIKQAGRYKNLALYLGSSALYRDGLNTLFAMGGLYAATRFGMGFEDILIFAIGLNVTAGIGAALFAFGDDKMGSRRVIMIALMGLIVTGMAILAITEKNHFILLALVLGVFIGPAQAASRTLVARLTPPGMVAQSYGIYNLTGKGVSFLGPLCYAAATQFFGTQQAGMVTILLFWAVGLVFLLFVREDHIYEHQD